MKNIKKILLVVIFLVICLFGIIASLTTKGNNEDGGYVPVHLLLRR